MDCGDWITLGAVLVALGIGVSSILHTQSLQKRARNINRVIQRIEEVQEWILEICSITSSGSPPGDEQEKRNRKWRIGKVILLKEPIKLAARKLDSEYTSQEKLGDIIDELSTIVERYKSNPESLAMGVRSGERIIDQIENKTNEAIGVISSIRDKL